MPGDDEDKPTARVDVSLEDLAVKLSPPPTDIDDPFMGAALSFEFNPLEIKQEGGLLYLLLRRASDTDLVRLEFSRVRRK